MEEQKIKRGPKPTYNIGQQVIEFDTSKLLSFRNTVYKYNKDNGTSFKYNYAFKKSSSKVTATRIEPQPASNNTPQT